jgi:hypothetical protein
MTTLLIIAAIALAFICLCWRTEELVYQIWVHYVAIMNIRRVHEAGTLSDFNRKMAVYALARGLWLDLKFCMLSCLPGFYCDWPRWGEWTFSKKTQRLCNGPDGWRKDRTI